MNRTDLNDDSLTQSLMCCSQEIFQSNVVLFFGEKSFNPFCSLLLPKLKNLFVLAFVLFKNRIRPVFIARLFVLFLL